MIETFLINLSVKTKKKYLAASAAQYSDFHSAQVHLYRKKAYH